MTYYIYSVHDNVKDDWSPVQSHPNDDLMALSVLISLREQDSIDDFDVDRFSIYRVGMYDDQICIIEPIDHVDITGAYLNRLKEYEDYLSELEKADEEENSES